MNDATLTIGQVASRAGLNVSAIRYYEREGLLPPAPRVSGQRRYAEQTLTRLGVIDVAKPAGFTLDDIRGRRCQPATRASPRTPGSRSWPSANCLRSTNSSDAQRQSEEPARDGLRLRLQDL